MANNLSLPDRRNYEYGYELAYKIAGERLAQVTDIESQCAKSGARFSRTGPSTLIELDYLSQPYQVTLPVVDVRLKDSEEPVRLRDKILILDYLSRAAGTPLSNQVIAYQELPEGAGYFPTFYKRAIKPLVGKFGGEPEKMVEAAQILGGVRAEHGDAAVTIPAFRRVPVTLVLWRGDEELPASGNILFDSTIHDYLSVEDINVLCEIIAWRLVKAYQQR